MCLDVGTSFSPAWHSMVVSDFKFFLLLDLFCYRMLAHLLLSFISHLHSYFLFNFLLPSGSFSIWLFNSLIHFSAVSTLFSFHFIIFFFDISTWLFLILVSYSQNLLFFPFNVYWLLDSYGLNVIQFVVSFWTLACELIYLVVRVLSDTMHGGRAEGQPSRLCWVLKEKEEDKPCGRQPQHNKNHSSLFQLVIYQAILQIRASPSDTVHHGRNGNFLRHLMESKA